MNALTPPQPATVLSARALESTQKCSLNTVVLRVDNPVLALLVISQCSKPPLRLILITLRL
jgi:hypothetical protein